MLRVKSTILLFASIFLFACGPQFVKVRALEPAEITDAASLKRIAVLEFKNDTVGLGGKIESTLSNKIFNNQPYFTLVNRKNIDSILKEQKMTGLLDDSTTVELGKLLGTEAIIVGEISGADKDDQNFSENRSRCVEYNKKDNCVRRVFYQVSCTKRTISLSANVRIVSVKRGSVIFTKSYSKEIGSSMCSDSGGSLTNKTTGLNNLAKSIAGEFVFKLTPNYRYVEVELLEDPIIDYSNSQEKLLENSLEFIKENNLTKAKSLLEQLHQRTGGKSLVAAYNLGTTHEALGNYQEAKTYYQIANNLQKKPIKAVNQALVRIEATIKKHQQAIQQLNR